MNVITQKSPEVLLDHWDELLTEGKKNGLSAGSKYTLLDPTHDLKIRVGRTFPCEQYQFFWELEVGNNLSVDSFPDWSGVNFEINQLDIPRVATRHLFLNLENSSQIGIFCILCAELYADLVSIPIRERAAAFRGFVERWSCFFEKNGSGFLSARKQQGLFGELWWLHFMLEGGLDPVTTVKMWHGCRRAYRDFETHGSVVEVKTTLSKEPRKIRVNNERQLDPTGLTSLHLLALSLVKSEGGGATLPAMVSSVESLLDGSPGAQILFQRSLVAAGYVGAHEQHYRSNYTVDGIDFYEVKNEFPAIRSVPLGVGDLTYSLSLAALSNFSADPTCYVSHLRGLS